jgi:formamidase
VDVTDGTPCGFDAPTRSYQGPELHPLVPDSAVITLKKAA